MTTRSDSEDRAVIGFIETEASHAFQKLEAPHYPFPLSEIVECLFALLHHRLADPDLDAVGSQILQAFVNYREKNDFLNLPDRLEAFLKFIQRLLKPAAPVKPPGSQATER